MNITVNLNMKLLPFDRGDIEDFLDDILTDKDIGGVTGGGTLTDKTGEVKNCDIEVTLNDEKDYDAFLNIIKRINLAKGSKVISEKGTVDIGEMEGLAVYLNGIDLAEEVYKNCDVNYVVEKLTESMEGFGHMFSYYEGERETALYFYGSSFEDMKSSIEEFVSSYPLCSKCRIVQIA